MSKKITAILFFFLCALMLFAPDSKAYADGVYDFSVSAACVNVGETVRFKLKTPSGTAKATLYVDGKRTVANDAPQIVNGAMLFDFALPMQASGTKHIRFYVYGTNGKLLIKYPNKAIPIKAVWPLYAPVSAAVTFLESDRAVLQATLAPGYTYKRYGFYLGTSQTALSTTVRATSIRSNSYDKLVTPLIPATTYYYQPFAITSRGVVLNGTVQSFTTPQTKSYTLEDSMLAGIAEKYEYLFHAGTMYYTRQDPPLGYRSYAEAAKHMVPIKVPVWVKSGGSRRASTRTLLVNRKLAENIKAIFVEIYALDMQFPIMYLRCFSYRTIRGPGLYNSNLLSHHSFGAAIDINKSYNLFYRSVDRRNPKNPYTIPAVVIAIFEKYGWAWGGDFEEGLDTMHFQYLGLDLCP